MEGHTQTEPRGGMIDESRFQIETPSCAAEVFPKVPLVEFGVGALNTAFLESPCAPTFDVSNVNAHAEKEPVVIVGTTGKGPRFRTPLELAFLALPNVALRHWAAKVFSRFILVKVNEIGAPSRIDVVGEVVMKIIGGIAIDS